MNTSWHFVPPNGAAPELVGVSAFREEDVAIAEQIAADFIFSDRNVSNVTEVQATVLNVRDTHVGHGDCSYVDVLLAFGYP